MKTDSNMKTVPNPFWNEHSARISQNLWLPSLDLIEREWSGELEDIARTKKDLRAAFLNKEVIDKMGKPWVSETPYDIRDAAMDDLLKAYDSTHAR
ncbi:hypothetical protein LIPSTDRAFT_75058, partial [Lipomyces starkeyi NRRL Y-11557]